MARNIIAYFSTLVLFLMIDFAWLTQVGPKLYNPILGPILLQSPRMEPAIAFYALYIVGLMIFAVKPGLAEAKWQTALIKGGLFGFFAYATYDLTNHATLGLWDTRITLADMAWGTFVSGVASAGGCLVAGKLTRA